MPDFCISFMAVKDGAPVELIHSHVSAGSAVGAVEAASFELAHQNVSLAAVVAVEARSIVKWSAEVSAAYEMARKALHGENPPLVPTTPEDPASPPTGGVSHTILH